MPSWLKKFFIIGGVLFLLAIAIGGYKAITYMKSEEGRSLIARTKNFAATTESLSIEAMEVARESDSPQICIDQTKIKMDNCKDDMFCHVPIKLFIKTCLSSTNFQHQKEFCKEIPTDFEQSVEWNLKYCERFQYKKIEEKEICAQILAQEIFNYCQLPEAGFLKDK